MQIAEIGERLPILRRPAGVRDRLLLAVRPEGLEPDQLAGGVAGTFESELGAGASPRAPANPRDR
jgi:hypothetical protein